MPKPVCTAEWPDANAGYSKCALDKPLLSGSLSQLGAVQSYLQAGGLGQAWWACRCSTGWLPTEGTINFLPFPVFSVPFLPPCCGRNMRPGHSWNPEWEKQNLCLSLAFFCLPLVLVLFWSMDSKTGAWVLVLNRQASQNLWKQFQGEIDGSSSQKLFSGLWKPLWLS